MNIVARLAELIYYVTCEILANFFASVHLQQYLWYGDFLLQTNFPRWDFDAWASETSQEFFIAFCYNISLYKAFYYVRTYLVRAYLGNTNKKRAM